MGFSSALVTMFLARSYRKKSKKKQCDKCNCMGFKMSVNNIPPQCLRCQGTDYI